MKVWVIETCGRDYYDRDVFDSVWSTQELAEEYAAALRTQTWEGLSGFHNAKYDSVSVSCITMDKDGDSNYEPNSASETS